MRFNPRIQQRESNGVELRSQHHHHHYHQQQQYRKTLDKKGQGTPNLDPKVLLERFELSGGLMVPNLDEGSYGGTYSPFYKYQWCRKSTDTVGKGNRIRRKDPFFTGSCWDVLAKSHGTDAYRKTVGSLEEEVNSILAPIIDRRSRGCPDPFSGSHDASLKRCQARFKVKGDTSLSALDDAWKSEITATMTQFLIGPRANIVGPLGSSGKLSSRMGPKTNLPNPNFMTGDQRLELIRSMLDKFVWERQDNQVDFHEMMIKTVLPTIFRQEWDKEHDRIMDMFSIFQHIPETFIMCPRRFGKTVSVAMFCAAYMYGIPDADIAIFSTAQRTSGNMMSAIYKFMKELPYFEEAKFTILNSEVIRITLYGVERNVKCLPGTVAVRIIRSNFIPSRTNSVMMWSGLVWCGLVEWVYGVLSFR